MEFPGVLKSIWKFQGLSKKGCNFHLITKQSCGISMGLGFWSWNSQGLQYNFMEFPEVKFCFLQNFQGYSGKPKNSRDFLKKVCFIHPCLNFFLEQPNNAKVWVTRTQKESPHFRGLVQVEYQCLKGRATLRQFTFLAISASNMICKHQPPRYLGICVSGNQE